MKKTRVVLVGVAVVMVAVAWQPQARGQVEPQKRAGPRTEVVAKEPAPVRSPGPIGAPVTVDQLALKTEVDTTMTRMDRLMKQSLVLSQSFAELAALHHGADRSEILMMQRVSDAMGSMASELKTTLAQYKRMLDDETSSENGAMKAEVDELNSAMQVIAGEVMDAIQTLRRLEGQLGQG
jgi:hypothetical protein